MRPALLSSFTFCIVPATIDSARRTRSGGQRMVPDGSVTTWIHALSEGQEDVAQNLWERYFQRMVELARNKLRASVRRAADEEDVALSAFHSFCTAAAAHRFPRLAN